VKAGVTVRAAQEPDLTALTDIYNHYVEHSHCTFDLVPQTDAQRRAWFAEHAETGPHRILVATENDAVLGYAASSRFRPKPAYSTSVEVSVYCRPDACGRGVGRSLYAALIGLLEAEDVHRLYAGVALPNDASISLHRHFGFVDVGTFREVGRKFGRYWAVLWMERGMAEGGSR
jgi:phosphinothricin acetyltransferase